MNQQLSDREEADREELDHFKREIDLVKFAERYGWTVHREESNQRTTTLRRGDDKMLVWHSDSYDKFWDCRTDQKGSVLDFLQQQEKCRLGTARLVLRRWIGVAPPRNVARAVGAPRCPTSDYGDADRKRIAAVWNLAIWTPAPTYLRNRGLDRSLHDERFTGTHRTTSSGMTLFAHRDRGGLSGFEIRGFDQSGNRIKRFASGGKRGLWWSRNINTAETIILCESAIDALSHCELYPELNAAYVSIAGEISTRQKSLLAGLFEKADSRNARVIIATDNDDAGEKHYSICQKLTTIELTRIVSNGKDWNCDLMDRR